MKLVEIDEDFCAILVCAIRYCLGRQTYMPSLVIDFIRPLLPHLDDKTLSIIENDIRNAESYGSEKIDKPIWVRFLSEVEEEICRRKEKRTRRKRISTIFGIERKV